MSRVKPCAKRPKGVPDPKWAKDDPRRSKMTRRCKSEGGGSGKSNNGGAKATFEQGGKKTQPGKRLPHHVPARPIS